MIDVGLIGYGFGGSVFHAPLISSVSRLRLSAVATSRRAQVAKELPGVSIAASAEELFANPVIDLIVVASPSTTHFEIAAASLRAGKHTVVDKPFATTANEANQLIELANASGLLLSVFQNRRWDGDFLTVKQCIDDGLLGKIFSFESHFDRFRPDIKPGWKEETGAGAGIFYDLGVHLVDQALQLFGMPQNVTADIFPQRDNALADDYFHVMCDYGQLRAILHGSVLVKSPGPRFAIHGDKGSFTKFGMDVQEVQLIAGMRPGNPGWGVESPNAYGELVSAGGEHRKIPTLPGAYEQFYEGIASALLDGVSSPVDPADSRDGLIAIEAALQSAAERRTSCISRNTV